jgi:hypothetical protein
MYPSPSVLCALARNLKMSRIYGMCLAGLFALALSHCCPYGGQCANPATPCAVTAEKGAALSSRTPQGREMTEVSSRGGNSRDRTVRRLLEVGAFYDAEFDRFGFYDDSGKYEHTYAGEKSGYLSYRFAGIQRPIEGIEIRARLSAESGTVGKPEEKSDVTLYLNGTELETKTVIPDDGKGKVYTWVVDGEEALNTIKMSTKEENEIKFVIKKEARYQNGLCIYGRSINYLDSDQGMPLTVIFRVRGNN